MFATLQTLFAESLVAAGRLSGEGFDGAAGLPVALLLSVAVAALLLVGGWLWRRSARRGRTSVTSRRAFTQAEGMFWSRLNSALPDHLVLMAVPLTRFVTVRQAGGMGRNQRKLEALMVDFGVFRPDGSVASVVILEDSDAAMTRRQVKLRRKLLERAGIKAVNWALKPLPSAETIIRHLNPAAIAYAAGGRGSARRSAAVSPDSGFAPDTRLVASQANPDFRPA